jgi:hypothetical protein
MEKHVFFFINLYENLMDIAYKTNNHNITEKTPKFFTLYILPDIPIVDYIERIYNCFSNDLVLIILAFIYLEKILIKKNNTIKLTEMSFYKLFLGTVCIAMKWHNDKYYNMKMCAKIGGCKHAEIILIEKEIFMLLDYNAYISQEEYYEKEKIMKK